MTFEVVRPRVVDTSVLFALFDSDDAHHAEARRLMGHPGPCVVGGEVLVEFLGLLKAKKGRDQARQALAGLRAIVDVELGHDTPLDAALEILDDENGLSLVDAAGVAMALRLGCDLDTFDERQVEVWNRLKR